MEIEEIVQKPIVYTMAGMEYAPIKRNLAYQLTDEGSFNCDVYYPAQFDAKSKLPAVILVHGDVDPGVLAPELLHNAKDWGSYISTSQLIAASGMIAIPFNHRSAEGKVSKMPAVAADILAVVNFVYTHAAELMVDEGAIGVWAWSDGVPYLSALLHAMPEKIKCLVAYYGMMDLQVFIPTLPPTLTETQRESMAQTLASFSLINFLEEKAEGMPPLFIAKAGLDNPYNNHSIDDFVARANEQGAAVELAEHAEGHHGFETVDEVERSREIVRDTLAFLKKHLEVS